MNSQILFAKECANEILEDTRDHAERFTVRPRLAIIKVGVNAASDIYVRNKEADARKCGIVTIVYSFPGDKNYTNDIISIIKALNEDDMISGIMVQLPLPTMFYSASDRAAIINTISSIKDVDGITTENMGLLYADNSPHKFMLPCTVAGIWKLLEYYNLDMVVGYNVTIIGRSDIVGKPLAQLFMQKNATVTVCHSHTLELKEHTKHSNIIVSAVGKPNFITPDMVPTDREFGIIDVGINRDADGNLCGDFHPDTYKNALWYTPIPGGIGLMTRAMLMRNTITAAYRVCKYKK